MLVRCNADPVYFTLGGAGNESRYFPYNIAAGGEGTFTITFTLSSAGIAQGFDPTRSSAWLPDTDGTALSAAALYARSMRPGCFNRHD